MTAGEAEKFFTLSPFSFHPFQSFRSPPFVVVSWMNSQTWKFSQFLLFFWGKFFFPKRFLCLFLWDKKGRNAWMFVSMCLHDTFSIYNKSWGWLRTQTIPWEGSMLQCFSSWSLTKSKDFFLCCFPSSPLMLPFSLSYKLDGKKIFFFASVL